jgi:hypothetical protein
MSSTSSATSLSTDDSTNWSVIVRNKPNVFCYDSYSRLYLGAGMGEIEILALTIPFRFDFSPFHSCTALCSGLIFTIQGENGRDYQRETPLNEA